jgi:hypothetical protein
MLGELSNGYAARSFSVQARATAWRRVTYSGRTIPVAGRLNPETGQPVGQRPSA